MAGWFVSVLSIAAASGAVGVVSGVRKSAGLENPISDGDGKRYVVGKLARVIDELLLGFYAVVTIVGVLDWMDLIPSVPFISPEWWFAGGSLATLAAVAVFLAGRTREIRLTEEAISQDGILWGKPFMIRGDEVANVEESPWLGVKVVGKNGELIIHSEAHTGREDFLRELRERTSAFPPPPGSGGPRFVILDDQWKEWQ
jgi:hypothetical protein